jgi:hypothetical protein
MKLNLVGAAILSAVLATGASVDVLAQTAPAGVKGESLRPAADFDRIMDKTARSVALFEEAGKVIMDPRCTNCHPAGDRPTQTDSMRPHQPLVVRGDNGLGAPGMACATCHHDNNFDAVGIPGHPRWQLAPLDMAWQGKTLAQICVQLKDPKRNGDRKLPDIVHHMAEDDLVGWGWHPDKGRRPVAGTQAEFGSLIKAWVDSGAHCPS